MGKETEQTDVPRWAKELGDDTWQRINGLIDDGWKTMDIMRELRLPARKMRSLQNYVRRFGPRRRLIKWAEFKDSLLEQVEQFGADMVHSLKVLGQLAVSDETPPAMQVRAFEAMAQHTKNLQALIADDTKAEEQRRRDEDGTQQTIDPSAMLQAVLASYGVSDGGCGGGGGTGDGS